MTFSAQDPSSSTPAFTTKSCQMTTPPAIAIAAASAITVRALRPLVVMTMRAIPQNRRG
jgi:hypothetical protein